MPEENTGSESEEQAPEGGEGQEPNKPAEENEPVEKESTEDDFEGTREDAIAALKKTRGSEAKYRTRLREVEEQLKAAKSPEEYEATVKKITEDSAAETRNLLVENVALAHKLPPVLQAALKGATREELEAHAKELAQFVKDDADEEPANPRGGLDPSDKGDDGFDPKAVARKARATRHRGGR